MISMGLLKSVMISLLLISLNIPISEGAGTVMKENPVNLPKTIDAWAKSDTNQLIHPKKIFDYMNGGGELYLAYGLDHLEVYHYEAKKQDKILVEIYQLKTSDDAFGLLSLDWGGEPMTLTSISKNESPSTIGPSPRALYGKGLLRIWSGRLYIRIMAYRETPESRNAVISLGKTITAGHGTETPPELLTAFPDKIGKDWKLRNDRLGYFHSHLVLNSLYFLSYNNILDLDLSTEAVTAPYENISKPGRRIQTLLIRYSSRMKAQKALNRFHDAYLSEQAGHLENKRTNLYNIEDGWLAHRLNRKCLTIVFEAPDRHTAQNIVESVSYATIK